MVGYSRCNRMLGVLQLGVLRSGVLVRRCFATSDLLPSMVLKFKPAANFNAHDISHYLCPFSNKYLFIISLIILNLASCIKHV